MPSLPRRVGEVRTSDWQGVHPDSTLGTIMFLRYHWKIWKHPRNPGHSWPEQWRQQRARVGVTDILSSHSPFFLSFFLFPSLPCLLHSTAAFPFASPLSLDTYSLEHCSQSAVNQGLPKGVTHLPPLGVPKIPLR